MSLHVWPCTTPDDMAAMYHVLSAGRRISPHSGYIHVGDLDWWRTYLLGSYPWDQIAYCWGQNDNVTAWSLFSPHYSAFDLFALPDVRANPAQMDRMLTWTIDHAETVARQQGHDTICTMWVFDDDPLWRGYLERAGFAPDPHYTLHYFLHTLDSVQVPPLPEGFVLRHMTQDDIAARTAAHRAAFASARMTDAALQRVMQASYYRADLDTVAAAPDGQIAAFALGWYDPATCAGAFEPVGTHPDFQGRGLAKAVLAEGLRRFKTIGAAYVIVYGEDDNPAARALYRAAGFKPVNRVRSYTRPVT